METTEDGGDISNWIEERRNEAAGGGGQGNDEDSSEVVDEAPSGDEAVLVPSGLRPSDGVQAAICRGDFPPLSEYEKLRERNIKEIEEAMKEKMKEIEEAKKDMRDNAPGTVKKAAGEEAGGRRRKKKVVPVEQVRRSGRVRKPVSYVVEEEIGGRKKRERREESDSPVRRVGRKPTQSLPSSTHTLRPRKPVNYAEYPEPNGDGFIWCSTCNRPEYNGCEVHTPFFADIRKLNLQVEKSSEGGGNAGQGVVNRGEVILEGVLFGPYSGKFIPTSTYEEIKKVQQETGNAWEVMDKQYKNIIGFIDPGVNPDPRLHWMAKINCPSKTSKQNLVGFQLEGQIYYRVSQDIHTGTEMLVWYGKGYATNLGIKVATMDTYDGKQCHTNEGTNCGYCKTGMDGEKELEEHLGKGNGHVFRCGVKQEQEMVRMAKSGERKHVCQVCGKGFKVEDQLKVHGSVHTKVKAFKCDVDQCGKSYTDRGTLFAHKKRVHEGIKHECPECGKRFGQKCNMERHYKNHGGVKDFKCPKCGVQFALKHHLTRHVETVHDKIRSFKCEHCDKSFGQAVHRKLHIEAVHFNIRYPCTWAGCTWTTNQKAKVKYHRRRAHTQEWSIECQLCEDQMDIWWGCIHPWEMDRHRKRKHPVEWKEEQDAYKRDHPHVCKYKGCHNRFGTKVEVERHERKLH